MVQPVLPARFTTLLAQPTSLINASSGIATLSGSAGGTDTIGGVILGVSGASAPVTWTGTVTSNDSQGFTTLEGRIPNEFATEGYVTPTDPDLLTDGFDESGGIAIASPLGGTAAVTSSLSYTFSSALPAGTSFYLWDPGVNVDGGNGPFTFAFAASAGGTAVSTAGWTVTAVDPFTGAADSGTYAFNASTGTLTVTNYAQNVATGLMAFPRKVLIVTPNVPVDKISVTSQSQQGDFYGLSVVVPAAQTTTTTDTVAGTGGTSLAIGFNTARDAVVAAPILDRISASVTGGTATVYAAGSGAPTTPSGIAILEATTGFAGALGTYRGFLSNAAAATTLTGGSSTDETVVTGSGGLIFTASSLNGGGRVQAGGGNNQFLAPAAGGGTWNVRFGAGNNTIVSGSSSDTIDAGTGSNLEFLGSGNSSVTSEGIDTIVSGSGAATVDGLGQGALVFAGTGGMQFTAASGANTVVAFAGGVDTLLGGSGKMLAFTATATQYIGGSSADTLVGIGAAGNGLTVTGGSGNSLYFGAASGSNSIFGGTGSATIFGGGAGDVLSTGGTGVNIVAAGAGAETISAAQSSGSNTFFLGAGPEVVTGGSGTNAYQIGTGAETLTGAGTANLFVFYNLSSTTRNIVITNFNAAQDFMKLNGFPSGSTHGSLSVVQTGGNTMLTLNDGTKITLTGVSSFSTQQSFT